MRQLGCLTEVDIASDVQLALSGCGENSRTQPCSHLPFLPSILDEATVHFISQAAHQTTMIPVIANCISIHASQTAFIYFEPCPGYLNQLAVASPSM
jgi:hypothetical protein